MTSLNAAWPHLNGPPPQPPPNPMARMPPPDHHYLAHPPQQPPPIARISPAYEPNFQSQSINKLESFVQESMSTINRNLESLKEDIRRQNDNDDRFDKLERLIKRVGMAILASIAVHAAISWLRAESFKKTLTANIAKLAASRITVEQVLNLVS